MSQVHTPSGMKGALALPLCGSRMQNARMGQHTVALAAHGNAGSGQPASMMSSMSEKESRAMKDLWLAARLGSPELVDRLLKRLRLPADTVVPETGLTLLLSVADVPTQNVYREEGLKDVMALLVDQGADLSLQVPECRLDPVAGSTALHLVFKQPMWTSTWRMTYLMGKIQKGDGTEALLGIPDCEGHLPEDVAHLPSVADELRRQRLIYKIDKREPY